MYLQMWMLFLWALSFTDRSRAILAEDSVGTLEDPNDDLPNRQNDKFSTAEYPYIRGSGNTIAYEEDRSGLPFVRRCSERLEDALEHIRRRQVAKEKKTLHLNGYSLHQQLRSAPYDMYVTDMRVRLPSTSSWVRVDKCRYNPRNASLETQLLFNDLTISGKVNLFSGEMLRERGAPVDPVDPNDSCSMILRLRRAGIGHDHHHVRRNKLQPVYARSARIIWDNSVDFDTVETYKEYGRSDVVRMPNWFFIFPGTKWCGPGNVAEDSSDLGEFRDTDKCCRNHDLCPDVIEGHQTEHNLTNPSFYSRLDCNCDEEFHRCLKTVDSKVSTQVGQIYFTALGTQCYKKEYPVVSCKKYSYLPFHTEPIRRERGQFNVKTDSHFLEPGFISVYAYGCEPRLREHRRSSGGFRDGLGDGEEDEDLSREMEDIFLKGIRSLLTSYMQKELQPAIKETLMRNMGYTISYG